MLIGLDCYSNQVVHQTEQVDPVKFWSVVLIAYHYIVLWDNGAESSDSKDNRPV